MSEQRMTASQRSEVEDNVRRGWPLARDMARNTLNELRAVEAENVALYAQVEAARTVIRNQASECSWCDGTGRMPFGEDKVYDDNCPNCDGSREYLAALQPQAEVLPDTPCRRCGAPPSQAVRSYEQMVCKHDYRPQTGESTGVESKA